MAWVARQSEILRVLDVDSGGWWRGRSLKKKGKMQRIKRGQEKKRVVVGKRKRCKGAREEWQVWA
jgi:hypothetical protein